MTYTSYNFRNAFFAVMLTAVATVAITAGADKADAMYDELLELMYTHAR